jgi:DNA-binding transcriptional LysR family regulator
MDLLTVSALAGAAAARDAAAAVRGLLRGTVVVGTEQCITGVDVPAVLAAFRAEHPGVDVRLRHEGSLALLEQIGADERAGPAALELCRIARAL